jgi:hypothetical protein
MPPTFFVAAATKNVGKRGGLGVPPDAGQSTGALAFHAVMTFSAMTWLPIGTKVMSVVVGAGMSMLCAQNKWADLREQDQKVVRAAPGADFHAGVGKSVPNVELPAHVVAAENMLTFYADFEKAGPNGIPLYLVNRTGRPMNLDAQDGDPYLKLEYRDDQGRWIRAQPHLSSWCGNSYYPVTLASGQHFRFHGYHAREGAPATVRYRSDRNPELVSNVGAGRVDPVDLAAAAVDDMSAASIPYALREVIDTKYRISKDNSPESFAAALRLLSRYHDSAYYRREAKRYLESLDQKLPEVATIQSLLENKWPVEPDRMGLLKHVHAVVSGRSTDASKGDRAMALKVIRDLLMDERKKADPEWNGVVRQVFGSIGESITQWNGHEADAAADVLAVSKATDEFVETEKLRAWLDHGNVKVVEVSANALSRRGDWLFLADKGFQLVPEAQIPILKALASGLDPHARSSRNPDGAREVEFWKHCATAQPVKTVQALQYIGLSGMGRHSFNMVLHAPLRAYLEKEADLAEKEAQVAASEEHGYPVAQVLQFVGAWQRKEDIPLFRRLLNHPGFQSSTSYESSGGKFAVKRFRVREDAKQVLNSMGVSVPDDIVFEEKTPLPDESGKK